MQHPIHVKQDPPMPLGVVAIIGGVDMILAETDRVRNLVGQLIDADLDAKLGEDAHDLGIEIGDRAREKADLLLTAVAGRCPQHVVEEIEIELEAAIPDKGSATWSARAPIHKAPRARND